MKNWLDIFRHREMLPIFFTFFAFFAIFTIQGFDKTLNWAYITHGTLLFYGFYGFRWRYEADNARAYCNSIDTLFNFPF